MKKNLKRTRKLLVLIVLCFSSRVQWSSSLLAQATAASAVQLAPVTQLRKGVDLWPLIVAPTGPPQQQINATLTRLNQRLVRAIRTCDTGYTASLKRMGPLAKGQQPVSADWDRQVEITMQGPRYLSLVASEEADCGGMYPNSDQMALVFDLATGLAVDWTTMVARSSRPSAYSDAVDDGSTLEALVLPALRTHLIAEADKECKSAFDPEQSFLIWPDARHQTIVALPFDLPHVIQACGNTVDLSIAQARKLGFKEDLLTALEKPNPLQAGPR